MGGSNIIEPPKCQSRRKTKRQRWNRSDEDLPKCDESTEMEIKVTSSDFQSPEDKKPKRRAAPRAKQKERQPKKAKIVSVMLIFFKIDLLFLQQYLAIGTVYIQFQNASLSFIQTNVYMSFFQFTFTEYNS